MTLDLRYPKFKASYFRRLSVRNFIWLFLPGAKSREGLLAHHGNHRDGTLAQRLGDFAIDKRIVESDLGSVRRQVAEVDAGQPRPIDRAQAHGTRFAGSINFAAGQLE